MSAVRMRPRRCGTASEFASRWMRISPLRTRLGGGTSGWAASCRMTFGTICAGLRRRQIPGRFANNRVDKSAIRGRRGCGVYGRLAGCEMAGSALSTGLRRCGTAGGLRSRKMRISTFRCRLLRSQPFRRSIMNCFNRRYI